MSDMPPFVLTVHKVPEGASGYDNPYGYLYPVDEKSQRLLFELSGRLIDALPLPEKNLWFYIAVVSREQKEFPDAKYGEVFSRALIFCSDHSSSHVSGPAFDTEENNSSFPDELIQNIVKSIVEKLSE